MSDYPHFSSVHSVSPQSVGMSDPAGHVEEGEAVQP